MKLPKLLGRFLKLGIIVFTILFILFLIAQKMLILQPPAIDDKSALNIPVEFVTDSLVFCGDSWLHTNNGNINELCIKGSPFEMGVKNGKLTQELAGMQEQYFVDFLKEMIPSEAMLNYLKYFIAIFNKDLDEYIPLNLRQELYGISLFSSNEYDFIGEKYHRVLNYHAAHDIGHTIQNMNLVNCTAFSVQNEYTQDSTLLIGRNFDFSAGDDFAREKLVVFCEPDTGYNFSYISWGGMIGVLSGMNEHGLTISLNSAKSGIPMSAKTPVSLISREVLQYAKTIEEAYEIIKQYDTFVSESFFIGSAFDNATAVVEKSLDATAIYRTQKSKLVLTNHFQSKELKGTELNLQAITEGCTMYRLQRTHELIDSSSFLNELGVVEILRDKNGLKNEPIGIGNESAVNQLICHHSVVFNPQKRMMWVSQFPYQENGFIAYDLNEIFNDDFNIKLNDVDVKEEFIKPSEFYKKDGVDKIWEYRETINNIYETLSIEDVGELNSLPIDSIMLLNPTYYYTHYLAGLWYAKHQDQEKALASFQRALKCQIPRLVDKELVEREIQQMQ